MPTPTIDPMAYEAAYAAIEQYQTNRSFKYLFFVGIICLFVWMFSGE